MTPRTRIRAPRRVIIAMALALVSAPDPGRAGAAWLPGYEYVSPLPGSARIPPEHTIALRRAGGLLELGLRPPAMTVTGSRSGGHAGTWALAGDLRTLVFTPATPFAPGEEVTVRLGAGPGEVGAPRAEHVFDFSIAPQAMSVPPVEPIEPIAPASGRARAPGRDPRVAARTTMPCDTMPSEYLPVTVVTSDHPDPGYIFLSLTDRTVTGGHLVILDNLGWPIFHRFHPTGASDFTRQPDGRLTYYSGTRRKYFVMDSAYVVVDSIGTGNGYNTDGHDLQLLPNGHWLLMAYDPQNVDMSVIVPGGNPNATVIGLIVQELDAAQNVVFQWRSWDHFQITDMVEVSNRSLTASSIDYVHGNAVELDLDGNLLISSRHLNEITKIDRQTGGILWRMGANAKNNQFTFINDGNGFSHQHDIRRLPNGHVTLYDNGNFVSNYSRAVEYALDEQNLVATLVWEFIQTPDNFGPATGSVRRRANGATLINWGLGADDPRITDLHADDSKALEFAFGDSMVFSYRARRLPWRTNRFVAGAESLGFGAVEVGYSSVLPLSIRNNAAADLELTCFVSSDPAVSVLESVPMTIPAGGEAGIQVSFAPGGTGTVDALLHLRSVHESELIAQVVRVTGDGTAPPGAVGPGPGEGGGPWLSVDPNPGFGERTLTLGLPETGPATLEIYDLGGRLVATPFNGILTAGTHRITWGGTAAGKSVTSGIFFARLTAAGGERIRKIVNLSR